MHPKLRGNHWENVKQYVFLPPSPTPPPKKEDQNLVSLAHTGNFAKYLSGVLHGTLELSVT